MSHITVTLNSAGGVVIAKVESTYFVALVQRRDDAWVLPKGHSIPGEDLEATARREIKEETGISSHLIEQLGYLGAFSFNELDPAAHAEKSNHFFLFRYTGRNLTPLTTDSCHRQAQWHELPATGVDFKYPYQRQLLDGIGDGYLGLI